MGLFEKKSDNRGWTAAALAAGALGIAALCWPSSREGKESHELEGRGTNGSRRLAIKDFEQTRWVRHRRAAKAFMMWSVTNVGAGALGTLITDGRWKYFHEMNMAWNGVSAAMTALGYRAVLRRKPDLEAEAVEVIDEARQLEEMLRTDIGLSATCAAAGAFMWDYGLRHTSQRLSGYGLAIVGQAAVVVIADSMLFFVSRNHRRNFELKLSTPDQERPRPPMETLH